MADLGLIDEYEFVVHPVLAGHGPTLFAGLSERLELQPAGDHTVVIGAIVGIDHDPSRRPVVYHRRTLLPSPAP